MKRAAWLGIGLLVLLRIWYGGLLELSEDEAYYWVWSRHLAAGYFDHPPAIAWLIRAGTALLGDTERGVRLGAALLGGGILFGIGRKSGLAALALATAPLLALGGLLATPDVPLAAAWTGGLLAALAGSWALVGLCAGLAMLSKFTGLLLLPLVVAARPGALRGRGPWIAAGIALLIYLPNAAWNLSHGEIAWRFQLDHVAQAPDRLGFLGAQWGLVGPLLFPILVAWWTVGWRGTLEERLCWWTSLPVFCLAVLAGGEANWAAPAYVGGILGIVLHGRRVARASWLALGLNATLVLLVMVHAVHPLLNLPVVPTHRLVGGRVLGEAIAAWGEPHVYTSRYQEAALIEFYGHVPARALPEWGRPDQYDLWAEPLPDQWLFVRVWQADRRTAPELLGWERGGPAVVTAYADSTDPLYPRAVARWQVYEVTGPPGATGTIEAPP